jgi:N-methylhydantoinase B/oxoprolinase/acetone carboxylase alpha subunit
MQQILAKGAWRLKKGSILRIETPGGGGWGKFKNRRAKTK